MKIEMELWHLVWLLLAFFGCVGAFGKVLLDQFEKRLGERFSAQTAAQQVADTSLQNTLQQHLGELKKTSAKVGDLERDFLNWKAELPEKYVRRDDYIRGQTVIEAKLDAVYERLALVQLRGAGHVG